MSKGVERLEETVWKRPSGRERRALQLSHIGPRPQNSSRSCPSRSICSPLLLSSFSAFLCCDYAGVALFDDCCTELGPQITATADYFVRSKTLYSSALSAQVRLPPPHTPRSSDIYNTCADSTRCLLVAVTLDLRLMITVRPYL